ncbi:MAG: DUF2304 domain-containing protein [Bacilli bacterium]
MNIYILGVAFSLVFLFAVVDLMRRRVLMEQYSLLWLGMGIVILLVSMFPQWLNGIAVAVGIYYAPSLLFLIGFLFMLGTMVHLTVVLSRLTKRTVRLAQEVAILKAELTDEGRIPAEDADQARTMVALQPTENPK